MSTPTSSYKSFLMYKTSGESATYAKLVDIKEFPDLGSAPNTLDATTLSDKQKIYVNDIYDPGALEFSANYDPDDFDKLKALEGIQTEYAIWFGGTETAGVLTPTGDLGKFEFKGELAVWVKGASVSAIRDMGISIAPSTEIKKVAAETTPGN